MGLFNGFSLYVLFEILFWVFCSLVPCLVQAETPPNRYQYSSAIFKTSLLQYCHITTLHGLVYIAVIHTVHVRTYWLLTFCTCFALSCYVTIGAFLDMRETVFVNLLDMETVGIEMIQYPTITLCTNQLYDRWNLPR